MKSVKQFEIYQVQMNPGIGFEISGNRPCLILQANAANSVSRTFFVAPLTSKNLNRVRAYQVYLPKIRFNGLKSDSKIKLDQMLVVDKSRLIKKLVSWNMITSPLSFRRSMS